MTADDLLTFIRAEPFQPFCVTLTSGKTYQIGHPQMVRVGKSAIIVFHFSGEPCDPYDRMEMLALSSIERAEPIPPTKPPSAPFASGGRF